MNQPSPSSQPNQSFLGLGIAPRILETLAFLKFTVPTPIQAKSIPIAIEGKDVIGIAQTGTGKTMAFGIPMLQRLAQTKGRGLVILPTRELAIQVDEVLHLIGKSSGLRTAVLIGGASMQLQNQAIRRNPHIIIATPGRLLDHLEQKTMNLHDVKILVLDEADRMLDMGFAPQIRRILAAATSDRQTMLFSATMPAEIVGIARAQMKLPIQVEIDRSGTTAESVVHELFFIAKEQKLRLLEKLLEQYRGPILVFSRTKHGAKKIARAVKAMGHTAADIHSDRSLAQRRNALEGFKSGQYRVLVATDIAARGIHVSGIELVINFDLPGQAEDYVHRVGRTGRAGLGGKAISFATPDQYGDIRDIEKLLRTHLPVSHLPTLPPARAVPHTPFEPPRSHDYGRRQPPSGPARPFHGSRRGARPPRRFSR